MKPVWVDATDVLPGNGGELLMGVPVEPTQTNQFYRLKAWRQ